MKNNQKRIVHAAKNHLSRHPLYAAASAQTAISQRGAAPPDRWWIISGECTPDRPEGLIKIGLVFQKTCVPRPPAKIANFIQ